MENTRSQQNIKKYWNFVNQYPTSHISHPEHPISWTFHIMNIPHPEHLTCQYQDLLNKHPTSQQTYHIPYPASQNIQHRKHLTSRTSYIHNIPHPKDSTTHQKLHITWKKHNRAEVVKQLFESLKNMEIKNFQTKIKLEITFFCRLTKTK